MTVSPMTRTDAAELAGLQRTSGIVNRAVWGVAVGVMVYGAGNVTGLLITHGVHPAIAWMLSPMVDLGLVVALVGGRALDGYGVRAGWLTVLRWTAGLMTWSLNTVGPFLHPGGADAVGVLIHSCGPVLLLVVAEAAASIQRGIATAAARLHRQADPAPGPDPVRPPALSSPPSSTAPPVPAAVPVVAGPARQSAGEPTPTARSARSARTRRAVSPADVDELLPLGWRIAADHDARGVRLTRDRLREAIRQTGQSISTDRAGRLLARLRTDPPSDPGPAASTAPPIDPADQTDRVGEADRPAAPADRTDRTDRTTALTEAGDLHG